jgi:UDP-N-acetylglucosamine--dolichyl-phosphate N-acetylglucosaminephosphotransferase
MPSPLTISAIFVSFFITFLILPYWIKRARNANLVGPDVHKPDKPLISELGGLCVIAGFLVSLLFFVATKIFVYQQQENIMYIFATISAILIAVIIGFVDDILGWKIGLRARYKVALTFFIALPIAVINAGHATMNFPFIGAIDFGLFYPLIFIPLAIIGTSNGFNMIAGYNGLEAGMGIIILTTLTIMTYLTGNTYVALVGACMIAALFAFYFYNRYPAKIFPGDTLTYPVGALIAIMAILGNVEKYALILFIPYFIELILKARGKLIKESFAKVEEDGSLVNQYDKWYGLEHIVIDFLRKMKVASTEKNVVFYLLCIQLFFSSLGVIIFLINNSLL